LIYTFVLTRIGVVTSVAFICVHELSRDTIAKGSYLERGSTAGGVNGVHLDPIKFVVRKDRDELPGLEFSPAHPSRGERYAEPRFGAGDNTVGRGDLYWPIHGYGCCPPRVRETPAGSAGETRAENAIVPGKVGGRLRRSPAGKVGRRGNGDPLVDHHRERLRGWSRRRGVRGYHVVRVAQTCTI
jgi:hypothetical protein